MEAHMSSVLWTLDIVLCGTLVWLAMQALLTRDLFKATVMYIVFGLVLALVWARLEAPDLALAEAAIGAGLTGALLLGTLASTAHRGRGSRGGPSGTR